MAERDNCVGIGFDACLVSSAYLVAVASPANSISRRVGQLGRLSYRKIRPAHGLSNTKASSNLTHVSKRLREKPIALLAKFEANLQKFR